MDEKNYDYWNMTCHWGKKTESPCLKAATWKHPEADKNASVPDEAYRWRACDKHKIGDDVPIVLMETIDKPRQRKKDTKKKEKKGFWW